MARPKRPTPRRCSVEGCEGLHVAGGFCRRHYQRTYRHGDPEVVLPAQRGASDPEVARRIIDHLAAHGPTTRSQIGVVMHTGRQRTRRLLSRLNAQGLVRQAGSRWEIA